jgi:hypothetical protein
MSRCLSPIDNSLRGCFFVACIVILSCVTGSSVSFTRLRACTIVFESHLLRDGGFVALDDVALDERIRAFVPGRLYLRACGNDTEAAPLAQSGATDAALDLCDAFMQSYSPGAAADALVSVARRVHASIHSARPDNCRTRCSGTCHRAPDAGAILNYFLAVELQA